MIGVIGLALGLSPLRHGQQIRFSYLIVGGSFLLLGLLWPRLLNAPTKWWLALGNLLHHIINPLVMGVLFFLGVLPIGLVMRALGADFLRTKAPPNGSYWVKRTKESQDHKGMENQF